MGLLQNGVLCFDLTEDKELSDSDDCYEEVPAAQSSKHAKKEIKVEEQETGYNFEIPTLGKKSARFYIPDGVTEKDIDYIKLYIENMLPVFLENLKVEIKQE